MTYIICKKLIELKEYTQEEADELQNKFDVFLLNNRFTQEEYEELTTLLTGKISDA